MLAETCATMPLGKPRVAAVQSSTPSLGCRWPAPETESGSKNGLPSAAPATSRAIDARHRRWARSLGGGSILDLGCYPVSMARLVAGAAEGKPFLDPDSVSGAGHLHPNEGVDDCTAATLGFPSGMVAQVSASMSVYQETVVRIYGTSGWLLAPTPWVISRDGGASRLVL